MPTLYFIGFIRGFIRDGATANPKSCSSVFYCINDQKTDAEIHYYNLETTFKLLRKLYGGEAVSKLVNDSLGSLIDDKSAYANLMSNDLQDFNMNIYSCLNDYLYKHSAELFGYNIEVWYSENGKLKYEPLSEYLSSVKEADSDIYLPYGLHFAGGTLVSDSFGIANTYSNSDTTSISKRHNMLRFSGHYKEASLSRVSEMKEDELNSLRGRKHLIIRLSDGSLDSYMESIIKDYKPLMIAVENSNSMEAYREKVRQQEFKAAEERKREERELKRLEKEYRLKKEEERKRKEEEERKRKEEERRLKESEEKRKREEYENKCKSMEANLIKIQDSLSSESYGDVSPEFVNVSFVLSMIHYCIDEVVNNMKIDPSKSQYVSFLKEQDLKLWLRKMLHEAFGYDEAKTHSFNYTIDRKYDENGEVYACSGKCELLYNTRQSGSTMLTGDTYVRESDAFYDALNDGQVKKLLKHIADICYDTNDFESPKSYDEKIGAYLSDMRIKLNEQTTDLAITDYNKGIVNYSKKFGNRS